jgi:murein tripeptide amidase MpaA
MHTPHIIVCFILCAVGIQAVRFSFEGFKVFRLLPQNEKQLILLHELRETNLQLDYWSEPKSLNKTVDIMVHPAELSNFANTVGEAQIPHSVLIENIEELLKEDLQHVDVRSTTPRRVTWQKYYRVDEINNFLEELATNNPDIASIEKIGKSYEGVPLTAIKIGKPNYRATKPAIWIDAGIHAREWVAPATATYIIDQLVNNYTYHQDIVDKIDWYILPLVNPDGYRYSYENNRMWRKTRRPNSIRCFGTDANRNFGYQWNTGGSSSNGCSDTYHGGSAFSEPETKALSNFVLKHKNDIKVYLTFHSYGQLWLTPWGYTSRLPTDYNDLVAVAKDATQALYKVYNTRYTIGSSTNVLYAASGGSDDWAKGAAGIKYSYTVELRDTGNSGFILPASQILPTAKETWEAVKTVARSSIFK